jgi:signal transduction histidine kinase
MEESIPFKPRARLIPELGDQLIKNDSIAFLELVKNSYDACAKNCKIVLKNVDNVDNGCVIIEDDGWGMDYNIIKNVWMEPGTDNKQTTSHQKQNQRNQSPCNRLPLGEKGIGRFAAHKLGNEITLISKKKGKNEVYIKIDWTRFFSAKYLDEVPIKIVEREPKYFINDRSGTKIVIQKLKEPWSDELVTEIIRSINNMRSPFDSPDAFNIEYEIDNQKILEKILLWDEMKKLSLFNIRCKFRVREEKETKEKFSEISQFYYSFDPWDSMKQKISGHNFFYDYDEFMFHGGDSYDEDVNFIHDHRKLVKPGKKVIPINLENHAIGDVIFEARIFDQDAKLLKLGLQTDARKGFKEYLKINGGVRVYRDGIRVYDYGELGNDWLDLGTRRVNVPAQRISNNIIIGAVHLKMEQSSDLKEKTNREGFIENEAYVEFKDAITYILFLTERFRKRDKDRIRKIFGISSVSEPVIASINELKDNIENNVKDDKLKKELNILITKIEKDYKHVNGVLLKSAGLGLSLSVIIHEIEKVIKELNNTIKKDQDIVKIKYLSDHLTKLIQGYSVIISSYGNKNVDLKKLIDQSLFNIQYRLEAHKIIVDKNFQNFEADNKVDCSRDLVISTLMNIFDNSIYWLDYSRVSDRKIFVSISDKMKDHISIVIADNGPGFGLSPEEMIQPFVSAKPGGMGLGLHIADQVMESNEGLLLFPDKDDFSLPKEYQNGAVIALAFKIREVGK